MTHPQTIAALSRSLLPSPGETHLRNRRAARPNINLIDRLPQVDGFFSLTPRHTYRVLNETCAEGVQPSVAWLNFLGVGFVAGADGLRPRDGAAVMPLVTAGQAPVFADDPEILRAFADTRSDPAATVFLPPDAQGKISAGRQPEARVSGQVFSNHEVRARIESPGTCLVVISQSFYPCWQARIDGRPVPIWRANAAFQALQVPAGVHELVLVYNDPAFHVGLAFTGAGILACVLIWRRNSGQNAF